MIQKPARFWPEEIVPPRFPRLPNVETTRVGLGLFFCHHPRIRLRLSQSNFLMLSGFCTTCRQAAPWRGVAIVVLWMLLGSSGFSSVVINEIMYHPVEEAAFTPLGEPV